jgi:hypothetical protein
MGCVGADFALAQTGARTAIRTAKVEKNFRQEFVGKGLFLIDCFDGFGVLAPYAIAFE